MLVRNSLLAVVGLAWVTGCSAPAPGEETENVASESDALSFTGTYWIAGTFDPTVQHKSYATCGSGTEMIGVAFDVDTPYVKCGISTVQLQNPYIGTSTMLGYHPACSRSTDGVKGFTYDLTNGTNTVTCGTTSPSHAFWNTYLDGAGMGTWGQESFSVGSGSNQHWVSGHVCGKTGYAAQGYSVDHDVLICGL